MLAIPLPSVSCNYKCLCSVWLLPDQHFPFCLVYYRPIFIDYMSQSVESHCKYPKQHLLYGVLYNIELVLEKAFHAF